MMPWIWFALAAFVVLGFATWLYDYLTNQKKEPVLINPINAVYGTITDSLAASDYYKSESLYHCARTPKCITIGGKRIWAGGRMFLTPQDIAGYDLLVPLTQCMPFAAGCRYQILALPLEDFGGVRAGFKQHVQEIMRELIAGNKMMVFCDGGLGRTGTVLASLVALMEPETVDPIAAVRERYREFAIETYAQAEAVFALRGQHPPEQYRILLEVESLRRSAWSKSRV
ncbi:MAG: hypothetical protein IPP97_07200 [Candidatus Obscuribacter sp.]|nr:hypothetical protein [Candidatus Obscuribacter sp.]MBP6348030.1 hypothetical protein [Candidatus Obscuribacter sp.]MBP7575092.1 hypothetical protein [Candidatus Obscuribacter sp.]